ncbi:MAG: DNA repair protein RecN, partial [Bacteroidales bacterium]|nr:DNA repair protein RecN [Bacteroidales bacterium]
QTLKDLGQLLTEIHSQHQTMEIGDENFQTNLVDAYAKNGSLLAAYSVAFQKYQAAVNNLQKLQKEAKESAKEAEYLHFRFDELDKAKLQENEQQELEEELDILSHNEDIKMAISTACDEMIRSEENTILQKLKSAQQALHKIESYYPRVAELAQRIEESYIELNDVAHELTDIDENTEYSPERLEFVNERLGVIYNLEKKFQVSSLEELMAIHKELAEKLSLVDNVDDRLQDLKNEVREHEQALEKLASEITESRKKAVEGLQGEIYELLESLGIHDSQFSVEFAPSKDFRPNGKDCVKYMFSANKNVAMADLSKTASGGELSRLMLCLKYILSRSTKLPTIIFDEIDTGISGDVAGKTGAMFRRIAEFMQVICITHLPQVAAQGHHHFKVYKHEVDGAIQSNIKPLDIDERIHEIAAMLSGETVSTAALMNATELLENANRR